MEHSITGEHSWEGGIDAYELPATDVQESMRNFPGCDKETYYTMDDIRHGDWSGTTDTDIDTEDHDEHYMEDIKDYSHKGTRQYSKINLKQGKREVVRNKLSATTDMYPTDKAFPKIKNPLKGGRKR